MFGQMLKLLTKTGRRDLALSGIFFALYGLSSIAMVITVFAVFFRIVGGADIKELYPFFFGLSVLVIFKGICNMAADLTKHSAGFDIVGQIRERMVIRLKKFSLGFYTNERLGEISTVLHKDVDNMSLVVGHMWPRMFGDFLIAAAVFIGLVGVDAGLAWIMALPVLLALGFLYLTIRRSQKTESQNNAALFDMVSFFVEYVRGIAVLRSFSNNKSLDDELMKKTERFGETSRIASRFKAKQLSIFTFLLDAGYFVLLVSGVLFLLGGRLDIFHFIVFAVVSKEFYKPFVSMEQHYMYYVSAADSYERLGRILDAQTIPEEAGGRMPEKNDIAFKDIEFSYEEDEFEIKDLSFSIEEKGVTAFVGESGSGKTTLTNLLLRFYDVKKGSIEIGGADIRKIPYDGLLDRISIVMQDVRLFDATIEENVRVGKRGASEREVTEACKRARIHDFIMSLPEGYKTRVGENGALLSGGQRQRLSIARAFLKDAPILILDEMTGNVDPVNESLIQDAITELAADRTVLVIAHRLKTIQGADQILVFRKGKLLERGRHQELLDKDGYYAKLWHAEYGAGL